MKYKNKYKWNIDATKKIIAFAMVPILGVSSFLAYWFVSDINASDDNIEVPVPPNQIIDPEINVDTKYFYKTIQSNKKFNTDFLFETILHNYKNWIELPKDYEGDINIYAGTNEYEDEFYISFTHIVDGKEIQLEEWKYFIT